MSEFLLELYSEEIPARFQKKGEDLLKTHFDNFFKSHNIPFSSCHTWSTPRRIGVNYQGLPQKTPPTQEYRKGPRVNAPKQALEGFLRNLNITQSNLSIDSDKKGEFYYYNKTQPSLQLTEILAKFIPHMITQFGWKRSMRWSNLAITWIRPLHTILCIFDKKIIPFTLGPISSHNTTYGHSVTHPNDFSVSCFDEYKNTLHNANVLINVEERKNMIIKNIEDFCHHHNLTLIQDDTLIDEVARLIEYPTILLGRFKPDYLTLPENVIISILRYHQKFFCLRDAKTSCLAPYFITVANIKTHDNTQHILLGNERVVNARLEDGLFSLKKDNQLLLEERVNLLERRIYFEKLGTLKQKAHRLESLSAFFSKACGISETFAARAGLLAKTDLTSNMVSEFPELQGEIGAYYAQQQKENSTIISCLHSQYLPRGPHDSLPDSKKELCVAIADKFDTLVGFFGINEKPTSSRDPFALRRAALGILRICIEKNLDIHIKPSLDKTIDGYKKQHIDFQNDPQTIIHEITTFFLDRLRVLWCEKHINADRVEAVLNYMKNDTLINISHYNQRLNALNLFLNTPQGIDVSRLVKRAMNMVTIEQKNDNKKDFGHIDISLCKTEQEKTLFQCTQQQSIIIDQLLKTQQYEHALKALLELKEPVNHFFDTILVNCDDQKIRYNRLAILTYLILTAQKIVCFDILQEQSGKH